jgi:pimeloyl-ACP methyl ester carboxylesterase
MTVAPHTILVHGFLRTRHDMLLLRPRLQYLLPESRVHVFDYPSRKLTLPEIAERLADFVSMMSRGEAVSFVGHSLGGLVVRALDAMPHHPAPLSRLVTLGTPHQGACVAGLMARVPVLGAYGGPILHDLRTPPLPPEPTALQVGCLIGHTRTKFGYLPFFGRDNDGLVSFPSSKEPLISQLTFCVAALLRIWSGTKESCHNYVIPARYGNVLAEEPAARLKHIDCRKPP